MAMKVKVYSSILEWWKHHRNICYIFGEGFELIGIQQIDTTDIIFLSKKPEVIVALGGYSQTYDKLFELIINDEIVVNDSRDKNHGIWISNPFLRNIFELIMQKMETQQIQVVDKKETEHCLATL